MLRHRILMPGLVLLSLLVLATAILADETTAVKVIKDLGGRMEVDDQRPGQPVVSVDLSSTKVTNADLKELKQLSSLQSLRLAGTQITDAGLKELKELKGLRSLSLQGTEVTDAGLKELQELENLRYLDVSNTRVAGTGVEKLRAALPEIKISFVRSGR